MFYSSPVIVYDELFENIFGPNDNKLIKKNHKKYFSITQVQKALNKSGLKTILQYSDNKLVNSSTITGIIYEINGYLRLRIFANIPNTENNIKYVKQFLNGQISDGWNSNGLILKNGYTIFFKEQKL